MAPKPIINTNLQSVSVNSLTTASVVFIIFFSYVFLSLSCLFSISVSKYSSFCNFFYFFVCGSLRWHFQHLTGGCAYEVARWEEDSKDVELEMISCELPFFRCLLLLLPLRLLSAPQFQHSATKCRSAQWLMCATGNLYFNLTPVCTVSKGIPTDNLFFK